MRVPVLPAALACAALLLMLAQPGTAASISLNNRQNCDGFTGYPNNTQYYYCHYSGEVTFSDPDNKLGLVQCWVSVYFAGSQTSGFINVSTGVFGYGKCATYEFRATGTGPYQTQDVAWREGAYPGSPDASGYKNWSP
jgi:hypothetical protein